MADEDLAIIGIGAETSGIDAANRKLNKLAATGERTERRTKDSAKKIGKSYAGLGKIMARVSVIAASLALGKGLLAAVDANKAFQNSISDLAAITGAAGDALAYYSDQAKDIGKTTTLSATQAAEAFKLIASAKPDLLESAEALNAVTREAVALAEAAGIDLPAAANVLGNSLNQFNVQASESGRFINVLAAGAKFGSSSIADTAQALKNAGTEAASVGLSFEGANAAIQVLAANAIKASEGGTALRNVLSILETKGTKDLKPSLVGLAGALENLNKKQLDATELSKLFGRENKSAAEVLLNNIDKFKKLEKAITGTGTAYEQAQIKNDNLAGDQKKLDSASESLAITLGGKLDPAARSATQSMTGFISSLDDLLASGEIGARISAFGGQFDMIAGDIGDAMNSANDIFGEGSSELMANMTEVAKFAGFTFERFPIFATVHLKKLTVRLAEFLDIFRAWAGALGRVISSGFSAMVDTSRVQFTTFAKVLGTKFSSMIEKAKIYGKALGHALNPFSEGTFKLKEELAKQELLLADSTDAIIAEGIREVAAINSTLADLVDGYMKAAKLKTEIAKGASKDSRDFITEEMDAALMAYDEQIKKAKELRDIKKRAGSGAGSIQEEQVEKVIQANEEVSASVGVMGKAYDAFGDVTKGVLSNIITDSELSFDRIRDQFKQLLTGMAVDAATNEIKMSFAAEVQSSATDSASSTATSSWWGAIIVAIAALGSIRNKAEDEKWSKFTAVYRQGVQGTGTVLGMMDAKSKSLNNLIEDMQKDNIDVLNVNYDMLSTLMDIRTGLAGVADGFAKTGFGAFAFDDATLGRRAVDEGTRHNMNRTAATSLMVFDPMAIGGDSPIQGLWDGVIGFITTISDEISKVFLHYDTSITDTGIEIFGGALQAIIDGGVLNAQSYADLTTEKKLIGINIGTELETRTQSLDEVVLGQLTGVFVNAGNALGMAAETFGIDFGQVAGNLFIEGGRLSLQDLEGDELTGAIESFFSAQIDKWAEILVDQSDVLKDFQSVGEGAFETVIRLSNETNTFASYAEQLGLNFNAVGLEAVYATQALADASGGFDLLTSNLNTFTSLFTSDADQLANVTKQLEGVFDELGYTVPQSHEAFSTLVQSIDTTTQGGAELFSTLIAISAPMDNYLTALGRQRDELIANAAALTSTRTGETDTALESLNQSVNSEIDKLTSMYDKQADAINAQYRNAVADVNSDYRTKITSANNWLKTLTDHFAKAMDRVSSSISRLTALSSELRNAARSNVVETQAVSLSRRQAAQSGLQQALATARSGGDVGDLSGIIRTLNQDNSGLFRSQGDLAYDSAVTANRMIALADLTDDQITTEQAILEALKAQTEAAKSSNTRLLSRLVTNRDDQIAQLMNNRDTQLTAARTAYETQVQELTAAYENAVDQVNALRQIDDSILGLTDAIILVEGALIAEAAARAAEAAARIEAQLISIDSRLAQAEIFDAEWQQEQLIYLSKTADSTEKQLLNAEVG